MYFNKWIIELNFYEIRIKWNELINFTKIFVFPCEKKREWNAYEIPDETMKWFCFVLKLVQPNKEVRKRRLIKKIEDKK